MTLGASLLINPFGLFAFANDAEMGSGDLPEAPATPVPGLSDDPMAGTQLMGDPEPPPTLSGADIAIGLDTASAPSDATLAELVGSDGGLL